MEISEATPAWWRKRYGGMKSEEVKRLKEVVAEKELDIRMLKHMASKNWQALLGNASQCSNFWRSLTPHNVEPVTC